MKKTRILITGGHGFIGSHLTRRLVNNGYNVGIIARETSDLSRINDVRDKIQFFSGDIKNAESVSAIVSDFCPNTIIHLATYYAVEHTSDEIGVMFDTNVLGTINLLEAANQYDVSLFINTSSCAVYEDFGRKLREDDVLQPQNLYALTKLQAEDACNFYAESYNLRTVTLRLFPPYGPADNERRLIPYLIKNFINGESPDLTTGKQKWDFVFVDDIIDAYVKVLLTHDFLKMHEVFNIGTGNAISIREIVTMIRNTINTNVELEWGTIPHRKNEVWLNSAEIQKSNEMLGWCPKSSIQDGLSRTVEWFCEYYKNK